jgi:hypothetical protein
MAGLLAYSPADVLRYLLVDLSYGVLPSAGGSWPIYIDAEPDTPDSLIVVTDTSSILEGKTQPDSQVQERYGFQVLIRGAPGTATFVKANAIMIGMDEAALQTVTISSDAYMVHAISRTTGVLNLGRDSTNSRRIVYTINGTTVIENTT